MIQELRSSGYDKVFLRLTTMNGLWNGLTNCQRKESTSSGSGVRCFEGGEGSENEIKMGEGYIFFIPKKILIKFVMIFSQLTLSLVCIKIISKVCL